MKLTKIALLPTALPDAFVKDGQLHISISFLGSQELTPARSFIVILGESFYSEWGFASPLTDYRMKKGTSEDLEEAVKLLKTNFPAIFEPKTKGQTIEVEIPYTA